MKKHPPPESIVRARRLRRDATDAERAMWRLLRECFPEGLWRHQVPIRHYIADFCSHRVRLVIEVDGGQDDAKLDAPRTAAIEGEGYRVLKFWNNEVLGNKEGVAAVIGRSLALHPRPAATRRQAAKSPHPSPIEGEGA